MVLGLASFWLLKCSLVGGATLLGLIRFLSGVWVSFALYRPWSGGGVVPGLLCGVYAYLRVDSVAKILRRHAPVGC